MGKVLQSQYYAYQQDSGNGGDTQGTPQAVDLGVITLDSWFVAWKGQLQVMAKIAVANEVAVISLGIRTQPTTIPGRWDITDTKNLDDLFNGYLSDALEALAVFGPANKMPLFYLLCPDIFTDNDIIYFKKIFRKGVWSGDNFECLYTKNTIEGADLDTAFRLSVKSQLKQVIAPNRW